MKKYITLTVLVFLSGWGFAQFKSYEPGPGPKSDEFQIEKPNFVRKERNNVASPLTNFSGIPNLKATPEGIRNIEFGQNETPSWISTNPMKPLDANRSFVNQGIEYISSLKSILQIENPVNEFVAVSYKEDAQGNRHIKYQQYFQGIQVDGAEIIVHGNKEGWYALNGASVPTPKIEDVTSAFTEGQIQVVAQDFLNLKGVHVLGKRQTAFLSVDQWVFQMAILNDQTTQQSVLIWKVNCRPNFKDHYVLYIDAITGEVLKYHNHICTFINHNLINYSGVECSPSGNHIETEITNSHEETTLGGDGPTVINDDDLMGIGRLVNGFQVGSNIYMIDASKTTMYNATQSVMPDDPTGVIWTIDAKGTSPQTDNFSVSHIANTNNNWRPLEVSAHYNGGEAFEYFLTTFGRNSVNGSGGNIVSIINVTDENENEMDNAFWNGYAMFYGNGIEAFNAPLARALDVAGHEMSHGVIQNTANLEYIGQSGALNESFADIFGAMIDRDDWKMGENVVNSNIFTTGALRDLSNPNNGGSQLGDPGWQPKHMNEFVNLPNTPEGDNGGVHINSGIVNFAFFKFASAVGKDKAEKVYFKALDDYLVKSSQFVDARNAVIQAATDLYGAAEVNAAKNAFQQVGIGEGSGGNFEEDIDVNPGQDIVICTDETSSAFYFIPPNNPNNFVTLSNLTAPLASSRMSLTDDASEGVYVDVNGDLRYVTFNWSGTLNYESFFLESNPQGGWRNIVISKDGSKIAYQSASLENRIFIYDFNAQEGETFQLFNPTTANGGNATGDVVYADAMEFDYSGEYLMYDALNKISGSFGSDIEYWDISFLRFWNNGTESFIPGQIGKLFTSLPEQISVGNPTFAKNSPFIIAFDFLESELDIFGNEETTYTLKAANLETGRVSDVFYNKVISWPSYSRLDDKIVFDAEDNNGTHVLATIDMQPADKIVSVPNSAVILISEAAKGTWSQTGERNLNVGTVNEDIGSLIRIFPNPTDGLVNIDLSKINDAFRCEIINQMGQVVQSSNIIEPRYDLNMSGLPDGVYMIKIETKEGFYTQSILKTK